MQKPRDGQGSQLPGGQGKEAMTTEKPTGSLGNATARANVDGTRKENAASPAVGIRSQAQETLQGNLVTFVHTHGGSFEGQGSAQPKGVEAKKGPRRRMSADMKVKNLMDMVAKRRSVIKARKTGGELVMAAMSIGGRESKAAEPGNTEADRTISASGPVAEAGSAAKALLVVAKDCEGEIACSIVEKKTFPAAKMHLKARMIATPQTENAASSKDGVETARLRGKVCTTTSERVNAAKKLQSEESVQSKTEAALRCVEGEGVLAVLKTTKQAVASSRKAAPKVVIKSSVDDSVAQECGISVASAADFVVEKSVDASALSLAGAVDCPEVRIETAGNAACPLRPVLFAGWDAGVSNSAANVAETRAVLVDAASVQQESSCQHVSEAGVFACVSTGLNISAWKGSDTQLDESKILREGGTGLMNTQEAEKEEGRDTGEFKTSLPEEKDREEDALPVKEACKTSSKKGVTAGRDVESKAGRCAKQPVDAQEVVQATMVQCPKRRVPDQEEGKIVCAGGVEKKLRKKAAQKFIASAVDSSLEVRLQPAGMDSKQLGAHHLESDASFSAAGSAEREACEDTSAEADACIAAHKRSVPHASTLRRSGTSASEADTNTGCVGHAESASRKGDAASASISPSGFSPSHRADSGQQKSPATEQRAHRGVIKVS